MYINNADVNLSDFNAAVGNTLAELLVNNTSANTTVQLVHCYELGLIFAIYAKKNIVN